MRVAVQTVDNEVLEILQRIALAQTVMAVVMCILGVLALGAAALVMLELRSVRHLMRGMLNTIDDLRPRLAPLIDQLQRVTDDIAGLSGDARRRTDDMLHTIEDVQKAVKNAAKSAEARVRRFDAVLDVVQTETEDLLLDAAAAAHGVQEAARVLREPDPAPRRVTRTIVRVDDVDEEEDHT